MRYSYATRRRWPAWVWLAPAIMVLVAIVWFVLFAFSPDRGRDVAILEGTFPTLRALGVQELWVYDGCERIVSPRGTFASGCRTKSRDPEPDVLPIDEQARRDLDAIYAASESLGRRITYAEPTYGPDGSIIGGVFGFEITTDYHYSPGYQALPETESGWTARVDDDWYARG